MERLNFGAKKEEKETKQSKMLKNKKKIKKKNKKKSRCAVQGDTDSESGPFVAVADAVAPKLRHFGMLRKNVCVWFRFFREGEGGKTRHVWNT